MALAENGIRTRIVEVVQRQMELSEDAARGVAVQPEPVR